MGVVPAERDAESHAPPSVETVTAVAAVAVTFAVWLAGAAPVVVAVKLSDKGLTVMVDVAPLTVSVTGTLSGLFGAPAAVTIMLLVYFPAVRPVVFAPMLSKIGSVPDDPVATDSHDAPDAGAAV